MRHASFSRFAPILQAVDDYYSARALRYGAIAWAADWDSHLSQHLRFAQLLHIVAMCPDTPLILHDLGCGYGALLAYLKQHHPATAQRVHYVGTDVSTPMIALARQVCSADPEAQFHVCGAAPPSAHCTVASGVFHVCLGHSHADWEAYVADSLAQIRRASSRAFAVNFLSPAALAKRPDAAGQLYVGQVDRWMNYCRDALGCHVRLLADYGLDEWTLLAHVPKDSPEPPRMRSADS